MFSQIGMCNLATALLCGLVITGTLYGDSATIQTAPINVVFTQAMCSSLPAMSVTLNGAYHVVTHVSKGPGGTSSVKVQTQANGTAVDDHGNQYVFSYINQ